MYGREHGQQADPGVSIDGGNDSSGSGVFCGAPGLHSAKEPDSCVFLEEERLNGP